MNGILQQCETMQADCVRVTSITEELTAKANRLSVELNNVQLALKALQDNPEVAETLNLIATALGRRY